MVLGAALVLLAPACGGSPSTPGSGSSIAGVWEGAWTSVLLGGTSPLRAVLTQSGSAVRANVLFIEHLCIGGVEMTGSVSGQDIDLTGTIPVLGGRLDLTGTIAPDRRTMGGGYATTEQRPCPADGGTWTLTRR